MNRRYLLLLLIAVLTGFTGCGQKTERIENARKYIGEWNYERAISELFSYRGSKDAEIQYLLGLCYLRKNEFEEAREYFGKVLASDNVFKDSIAGLYTKLAKNLLRARDKARAVLVYHELVMLIPDAVQAEDLFLIGDVNFEQQCYPLVVQALTKALSVDSTSALARRSKPKLIKALIACDSLAPALAMALAEYRRSKIAENVLMLGEVKYAIGIKHFESDRLDSAKFFLKEVIDQQEPKSLLDDAYFWLGEIYLKQDSAKTALDSYKKVLRLNPYQKGGLTARAMERIREIQDRT